MKRHIQARNQPERPQPLKPPVRRQLRFRGVFAVRITSQSRTFLFPRSIKGFRALYYHYLHIREISAPEHYLINDKVFYAEIKLHNDLIQFVVEDENEDIGVTLQKIGNIEAMPGDLIRYDLQNIQNASNVPLNDFYVRDVIPTDAVRLEEIHTGTWSEDLTYKVAYKTNLHTKFRTAADRLHTR